MINKKRNYLFIIAVIILFIVVILSNIKKPSENIILNRKEKINEICQLFAMKPRTFVGVIYGELSLNYNYYDKFDELQAKLGLNPSVGVTQIRVSTALWLEDNYADNKIITKSKSHKELVNKIINDSANILYSAYYVKLIYNKLLEKFQKEPSIKLLASYYGRGIDYSRDDDLDSLFYNQIGITAEEFFYSDMLIDEFPR